MTDYVELHCRSAFSFLRAASLPEQLSKQAAHLQMPTLALCDRDGLYGAPRFHSTAREQGLRPIVGAELTLEGGAVLPVLVQSRTGYQNLSQLLTRAHLRNEKGKCSVYWDELPEFAEGLVALTGDGEGVLRQALAARQDPVILLERLRQIFGPNNLYVEIQRHHVRGEDQTNRLLVSLAAQLHLPVLVTNGVLYDTPAGRFILDAFVCLRSHTHLDAAGKLLSPNAERCLKDAKLMRELFSDLPEAIENTARLAERLDFTLENLGY